MYSKSITTIPFNRPSTAFKHLSNSVPHLPHFSVISKKPTSNQPQQSPFTQHCLPQSPVTRTTTTELAIPIRPISMLIPEILISRSSAMEKQWYWTPAAQRAATIVPDVVSASIQLLKDLKAKQRNPGIVNVYTKVW